MTVTNILDLVEIKEELVVFLRNQDIFSIAARGVTTTTETFNGTGAALNFTLTHVPARNVRSVTVNSVAVALGSGYNVNYATAVVTFAVAPGVGTNNVSIQYDYGSTDKIYADFPRADLNYASYPRISLAVTSVRTTEIALGGKDTENDLLISVYIYADGATAVDGYLKTMKQKFLENKTTFYYLTWITPVGYSSINPEPNRAEKIESRVLELRSKYNIETVT